MGDNNVKTTIGEFVVPQRQDIWEDLIVNGKLTLEAYSCVYGTAEVINGTVSLGDYAFINSLHMSNSSEIFFDGRKPCIRSLQANGLIVHIHKSCERWTDFIQINNTKNVKVIRDLD